MNSLARIRRAPRAVALLIAFVLTAAVGCGPDPFTPRAQEPTLDTSVEVWALTGSPTNFPTVLLVPLRLAVRPDAAGSFDLGFDIDAQGRLLVLPASRVVASLAGSRRVGLIRTDELYNTITEAPRDGWIFDSTLAVNVGQTFIVRVQSQVCQFEFSPEIYAKYRVDSVLVDERRIKLVGRVNPNCGFRSFLSGIPTF